MIQVVKLGGDVIREFISEIDAGGEAVSDTCLRDAGRRIDRAIPLEPVADGGPDFVLLRKSSAGENNRDQKLHSAHPASDVITASPTMQAREPTALCYNLF